MPLSTSTPPVDSMPAALQRAGDDLERLMALLEQEFETLKKRDIDAFEATQEDKNRLLVDLAALAAWARAHQPVPAAWQALQERLEHARDLHMRNLQLMQRQLDAVRGTLQTLRGDSAPTTDLYDRMGHLAHGVSSYSSFQLA